MDLSPSVTTLQFACPMDPGPLTADLKRQASRLGFDLVGACAAVEPPGIDRFAQWLADGFAGEMSYLADRRDAYAHPRHVLDGVQSILMLGLNYRTVEPVRAGGGQGTISRYAWGIDYHDLIHERLGRLAKHLRQQVPDARVRGVVDTAPLLEREFAQLAGLGWIGKNTLLLNPRLGSWFFLAALLTDQPLAYDAPFGMNHCGTCRACIDACPTGALVAPYRLDARRCISYLTIELRGSIPDELRSPVGDWLFGCDVCQEVCPWNRKAPTTEEPKLMPLEGHNPAQLAAMFLLDDAAYRARFRHTPLWRAKRRGLLRNAALLLGNRPSSDALPALTRALRDTETLVRAAAAWALGRYDTAEARQSLRTALARETDAEVRGEIERAIDALS